MADIQTKTIFDYVAVLRRRKRWLLGTAIVILGVTVAVALSLPSVYRSSATILIEQQEIPTDLVRSTVTSYADERIQMISQRAMTRTNLLEIIKKYNLYPDEQKSEPAEVWVENMRDDIGLDTVSADVVDPRTGRPTSATIAFTVSYESESAVLAQKVASELTSLYLSENLKKRTQMASEASHFLEEETNKLADKISVLEKRLAEFKERNGRSLPEMTVLNIQRLDRTEQDMNNVREEIRALKERRIYLESELAKLDPDRVIGDRVPSPGEQLKSLKAKYVSDSAVYAADHPDVVRLHKQIEALEKEVNGDTGEKALREQLRGAQLELMLLREKYAPDYPDVVRLAAQVEGMKSVLAAAGKEGVTTASTPENPAYIQLLAQLKSTRLDLETATAKLNDLTAKHASYEERIARAPFVEKEYRALTRDYENSWAKYQDLKSKQMEAQLAETLEAERKGERFTLIEPAVEPAEPARPNRIAILLAGIVFSLIGGIGAAALRESQDRTVRDSTNLTSLLDFRPLAVVPYIVTQAETRQRRLRNALSALGSAAVVGGVVLSVNQFYKPLDVLWYVVLRRLGLS